MTVRSARVGRPSDLANSDALTLSRLVDPDGKRTIGGAVCASLTHRLTHEIERRTVSNG